MKITFQYEHTEKSDVLEAYAIQKFKNELSEQVFADGEFVITIHGLGHGIHRVTLHMEMDEETVTIEVSGSYVFDCIDRLTTGLVRNLHKKEPKWGLGS